jgi:phage baseplate assembly protein W
MANQINNLSLIDFDYYGRSSTSGGPLIHQNDFAISNSMAFYLTLRKGSYLYNPTYGGLLEGLLFKALSPEDAISYQNTITNDLKSKYSALITNVQTRIFYNTEYTNRIIEVQVYYTSLQTNETNSLSVYLNAKKDSIGVSLLDVNLEGDNLIAFVNLQLATVNQPLTYNVSLSVYTWGNYRLNNLKEGTETFDYIKNLLGYQN